MKMFDMEVYYYYYFQIGFMVLLYFQGVGLVYVKFDGLWVSFQGSCWIKFDYKINKVLKFFVVEFGVDWIVGFCNQEDWFCYFFLIDIIIVIVNVFDDSMVEEFL